MSEKIQRKVSLWNWKWNSITFNQDLCFSKNLCFRFVQITFRHFRNGNLYLHFYWPPPFLCSFSFPFIYLFVYFSFFFPRKEIKFFRCNEVVSGREVPIGILTGEFRKPERGVATHLPHFAEHSPEIRKELDVLDVG